MTNLSYEQAAKAIEAFAVALPGPYGFENSLKITASNINQRRFLISFPAMALSLGVDLSGLLKVLQIPERADIASLLNGKDIVHLGVEASGATSVCKLYGESAERIRQLWDAPAETHSSHKNLTVHRALKWTAGSQVLVHSDYDWLPCTNTAQLLEQVNLYVAEFSALVEVLSKKARCPVSDLHLLRVTETEQGRLSLDLNVYDGQLTVQALLNVVQGLAENSFIDQLIRNADTIKVLKAIATESLGHVAAGLGRDGKMFLSVYYGAQERGDYS